jgi:hypothetical protein
MGVYAMRIHLDEDSFELKTQTLITQNANDLQRSLSLAMM